MFAVFLQALILSLAGGVGMVSELHAADLVLPPHGQDQHLGVVSCAGSTCHGANEPSAETSVLQDEFVTWHRKDRHAKAYEALLSAEGKRIGRNLGMTAPQSAKECLDCHADNVSEAQRGKRFHISDGVTCENCHGGGERYLGPHSSGRKSHAENVGLGLYPVDRPRERATLCLSCHLGTKDQWLPHRIMGAGHPRLSFELENFTELQPTHFQIDKDYRERKDPVAAVQLWATGQWVAAQQFLDLFLAADLQHQGVFPEFGFFDCHSCHRSLNHPRWAARALVGLGPGLPHLTDANFVMLNHVVRRSLPERADQLRTLGYRWQQSTRNGLGATRAAATELRDWLVQNERQVLQHEFSGADIRTMLDDIVKEGLRGEYGDYANGEQAVMAIVTLIENLRAMNVWGAQRAASARQAIDGVYRALQDQYEYKPEQLRSALRALNDVMGPA
jgi:hypothetical protein